jgi:hypothetical protein
MHKLGIAIECPQQKEAPPPFWKDASNGIVTLQCRNFIFLL